MTTATADPPALAVRLPRWDAGGGRRTPGSDEDAVTLAVAAGRAALDRAASVDVHTVVLVTRQPALLEGGSAAVVVAALGLPADTACVEQLGGAPAAIDAIVTAQTGTLVLGVDVGALDATDTGAGAGAYLATGASAPAPAGRVQRSLPVRVRDADGRAHEQDDARLARERGYRAALSRLDLEPTVVVGDVPGGPKAVRVPTAGASSPFFAMADLAGTPGPHLVVGVEQATAAAMSWEPRDVTVERDEPAPLVPPDRTVSPGPELPISLPAYDRAFDSKLRFEAVRCTNCGELAYPPRWSCLACGHAGEWQACPLPRTGVVYSTVTVHVPVPGLPVPYSLAIVQLDSVPVRVLATVTDALPGSVEIGQPGRLVLRRVAVRSGVPDYGYAFAPEEVG